MRTELRLALGASAAVFGAGVAGGAAGVLPWSAAAGSCGLAALAAGTSWLRAWARPELELFGPSLRRGAHHGRLAVLVAGDRPELLPALAGALTGTTVFLPATGLRFAGELGARGVEVGLLWEGGELPELATRWVLPRRGCSPRLYTLARARGLRVVWPSVDLARSDDARLPALAARAVGTDLVRLGIRQAHRLPELRSEWEARGIEACGLGLVMEAHERESTG